MLLLIGCVATDSPHSGVDSEDAVRPAACSPLEMTPVTTLAESSLPTRADLSHTVQGVGVGDLDGDGWLDALVAWGGGSFGLRNDGAGGLALDDTISLVSDVLPASEAVALADLDGDGDLDAMFGSWQGDAWLLWNDGSGRFTAESIPGTAVTTYAIAFGDADGDGDLDAYLSAAVQDMTYEDIASGSEVGDANLLLLQGPDHRFAEAVGALPEDTRYGMTLHTVWLDVEGDGDLDLYVGNDAGPYIEPNHLLLNDGLAHFTKAADCGCDLALYSMGVAVGDANQDGLPDLYVTDVGPPELLFNTGDGSFANATLVAGDAYIPATPESMVSWGTGFVDLDADRDQDLIVTFGQSGQNFEASGIDGVDGPVQPNQVLLSDGVGGFARSPSDAFADGPRTRAYASGDFDRDGRPDLLSVGKYFLQQFHTEGGCPPGATLRLYGQNLIGAQIDVEVGGASHRLWHLPSTTSSSNADEVYVGFGGYPSADRIVITWRDGQQTELVDVPLGSVLDVEQP